MKIRKGFVSNSSSSSFVINTRHISGYQLERIINHSPDDAENRWSIEVEEDILKGYTFMNNFSMEDFMLEIGVDMKYVNWE